MSFYLFACNRYYPNGGAEDLVGVYNSISDKKILAIVADLIRKERLEKDDRLKVSGFLHDVLNKPVVEYWEFRMAEHLEADSLHFCSVKETFDDLGPCGLVPLTRAELKHSVGAPVVWMHPTRDPEKRDITYLP